MHKPQNKITMDIILIYAQSYSYTYTIDAQGNYHYTWTGNWNPSQLRKTTHTITITTIRIVITMHLTITTIIIHINTITIQTIANNNKAPLHAFIRVIAQQVIIMFMRTTTAAPSSNGRSNSNGYASGSNYILQDNVLIMIFLLCWVELVQHGVTQVIGLAQQAASSGYTVNNTPKAGAIMQTTQGYYGHVAYVEGVNSNGSVRVSEMNDGHGAGVVTSRTISANQAGSYNFIH